jgi:hypothetical protein
LLNVPGRRLLHFLRNKDGVGDGVGVGRGPVCDEFDSRDLDDVFGGDDVVFVFRENVMTFHIIQEIRQHVALCTSTYVQFKMGE